MSFVASGGNIATNFVAILNTINLYRIAPFSIYFFNVMNVIGSKFKWIRPSFEKIEHQFTFEFALWTQAAIGFYIERVFSYDVP